MHYRYALANPLFQVPLVYPSVFQSEIQGKIKPKGNLGTVDPGNQVSKDPGNRFMTELKLEQGIAGCLCFQYRNP